MGRHAEERGNGQRQPPETDRRQCGMKRLATSDDTVGPFKKAKNTVNNDSSLGLELRASEKRSLEDTQEQDGRSGQSPFSDPVYRIMHTIPRSDVLEIVRCRFGPGECERASLYFDSSYMNNPLRHLRLQIGCDRSSGLQLFFPKLHHHRKHLRLLDLSRNDLDEDDVATLMQLLDLLPNAESGCSESALEVLDLSYNRRIGNRGALLLLSLLRHNDKIRAVILKGISVDDSGAVALAPLLRQRPLPRVPNDEEFITFQETSSRRPPTFFVNLNENRIGAVGTTVLGKRLPVHVSLTVCKQCPLCVTKRRNS